MWRTCLISLGILTMVLAGFDAEVLVAKPSADAGSYEVVALVAD
jgi:hypothetical protein